jgi:hypothetical protein
MRDERTVPIRPNRLNVGMVMLQIAGVALGLWLVIPWLRARAVEAGRQPDVHEWLLGLVFVLGGISLLGPPLLLVTARNLRWAAGRLLWSAYGTAVWVLWPPMVYKRIHTGGMFYSIGMSYSFDLMNR